MSVMVITRTCPRSISVPPDVVSTPTPAVLVLEAVLDRFSSFAAVETWLVLMGVLSGMLKLDGENFVACELCLFERDGESVSRPQTTSPLEITRQTFPHACRHRTERRLK